MYYVCIFFWHKGLAFLTEHKSHLNFPPSYLEGLNPSKLKGNNRNRLAFYMHEQLCSPFPELPEEGPVITGGLPNYQLNDQLALNCTSPRTFPPTLLKWSINNKMVGYYWINVKNIFALVLTLPQNLDTSRYIKPNGKDNCCKIKWS